MAIKGNEKTEKGFKKYVGMFNANVVAINPTKEELSNLLGTDVKNDIEYTGYNNDGNKKLTLGIWLSDVSTGQIFPLRLSLEDTVVVSKSGKTQYINDIGVTSYSDDPNNLPSWVSDRPIRKAKKGEENLYKFLTRWLSHLDYDNQDTEVVLDWEKLISGNVKELRETIDRFKNRTICVMAIVRTSTDGKDYQSIYSQDFLPSFCMDYFLGVRKTPYKSITKFIEGVKNPEYGCKDFYKLSPLEEYNPQENIIASTDNPVLEVLETEHISSLEDDLPF